MRRTRTKAAPRLPHAHEGYLEETRRPLNCLLFILPLLLIFQIGTAVYGTPLLAPRDIHKLLSFFGATAPYLPPLLIILVLMLEHLFHKHPWRTRPMVFAGMAAESVLWSLPILALSSLTSLFAQLPAQAGDPGSAELLLQRALLAVGAGIYEEFLFRLVIISLVLLIFVDVFQLKKKPVTLSAVAVSAMAFSLYHFSVDQLMNPLSLPGLVMLFYALAGAWLALLFVWRGYGIAVGAHICYNLIVALG
ncbi:MAG: type II CAAX prenyl endopeptidase Rce1 family protein [Phycisphaerae bacterium]